jgi:hypothetical protein
MRFSIPLLTAALLGFAAASAAGEPSSRSIDTPLEAKPAPESGVARSPLTFECGPIRSRDPEVRAQIRQLYRSRYDLELSSQTRLEALVAALAAEADADARLDLQRQAVDLKRGMQLESMRYGLEIARLDGDAVRAAEYEKAIDQMEHPETHRPATLDPAVALERARAMGLVE